jgi:hypothetical protein
MVDHLSDLDVAAEGTFGFVIAISSRAHGLSFWRNTGGFGPLFAATVFSEIEAVDYDLPIADDEPEWLALPAPLHHPA